MVTAPRLGPTARPARRHASLAVTSRQDPVPAANPFVQLARLGHYAGVLYRRPHHY